jgi:uncharacterized membrane protein YiaA
MEEIRIMKKDILSSLFLLLFGFFFAVESFKFGLGEWGKPGPGYFPFGAGLLFGIISLSVFVRTLRKTPSSESSIESSDRLHWQNIALVVVGLFAYALLLRRMGFALCTFGLVVFCIHVVARRDWFNSIMTGLVVAVVFHVFFNVLLNAQLPNGLLGVVLG